MERDSQRNNNNNNNANGNTNNTNSKDRIVVDGGLLLRLSSETNNIRQTTSSGFVLQWGNRKRFRCMKVQVKDDSAAPVNRSTVPVDRRVVRAHKDSSSNQPTSANNNNDHRNGYFNLRQRPSSPPPPPPQCVLRY